MGIQCMAVKVLWMGTKVSSSAKDTLQTELAPPVVVAGETVVELLLARLLAVVNGWVPVMGIELLLLLAVGALEVVVFCVVGLVVVLFFAPVVGLVVVLFVVPVAEVTPKGIVCVALMPKSTMATQRTATKPLVIILQHCCFACKTSICVYNLIIMIIVYLFIYFIKLVCCCS